MAEKTRERKIPDFEEKQILFEIPKNETANISVRLMTNTDKTSYVDIREKVTSSKNGFKGYTKKGITLPVDTAALLVEKLHAAIGNGGKDKTRKSTKTNS